MDLAENLADLTDVELRLVDPAKNKFRIYGVTECATLFGELCLRIVWGRIGNRRLRERSEVFGDRAALMRRRDELLRLRRRHGYVAKSTPRAAAQARAKEHGAATAGTFDVELAILEAHGFDVDDSALYGLVSRWRAATTAIVRHLVARGAKALDLVDASTLAAMFAEASAA